jgi:hypothetical protein
MLSILEFSMRLFLALALGAVIGVERQWRQRMKLMKEFNKWLIRILMVFVAVSIIDVDCSNMRPSPDKSQHIVLANLILGGLLVFLLITQIKKRRL